MVELKEEKWKSEKFGKKLPAAFFFYRVNFSFFCYRDSIHLDITMIKILDAAIRNTLRMNELNGKQKEKKKWRRESR